MKASSSAGRTATAKLVIGGIALCRRNQAAFRHRTIEWYANAAV